MNCRTLLAIGIAASLMGTACGPEEKPYKPKPAYSGKKPSLPNVPTLPNKKKKEGDAYTVWGAIHDLRSVVHERDFEGKQTSIVGWIIKVNWEVTCKDELKRSPGEPHCVPECAIHKQGKADPPDCKAPVPTFWIADSKEEKDFKRHAIPVKGFASNFSKIFTLVEEIDKDCSAQLEDAFLGFDLPNPIPNVGGRFKVTGPYGKTFTGVSGPAASNPRTGILDYDKGEWLEAPPKRAFLPGQKLRNPDHEECDKDSDDKE